MHPVIIVVLVCLASGHARRKQISDRAHSAQLDSRSPLALTLLSTRPGNRPVTTGRRAFLHNFATLGSTLTFSRGMPAFADEASPTVAIDDTSLRELRELRELLPQLRQLIPRKTEDADVETEAAVELPEQVDFGISSQETVEPRRSKRDSMADLIQKLEEQLQQPEFDPVVESKSELGNEAEEQVEVVESTTATPPEQEVVNAESEPVNEVQERAEVVESTIAIPPEKQLAKAELKSEPVNEVQESAEVVESTTATPPEKQLAKAELKSEPVSEVQELAEVVESTTAPPPEQQLVKAEPIFESANEAKERAVVVESTFANPPEQQLAKTELKREPERATQERADVSEGSVATSPKEQYDEMIENWKLPAFTLPKLPNFSLKNVNLNDVALPAVGTLALVTLVQAVALMSTSNEKEVLESELSQARESMAKLSNATENVQTEIPEKIIGRRPSKKTAASTVAELLKTGDEKLAAVESAEYYRKRLQRDSTPTKKVSLETVTPEDTLDALVQRRKYSFAKKYGQLEPKAQRNNAVAEEHRPIEKNDREPGFAKESEPFGFRPPSKKVSESEPLPGTFEHYEKYVLSRESNDQFPHLEESN